MPNDIQRPAVKIGVPAPYLRVNDAARAIQFYADAFGATQIVRLAEPSGRVAHAELRFGGLDGATVMLSDEYPENGLLGPAARGGTSVALIMYVPDVDDVCARVERAGGVVRSKPKLDPFGDRTAKITDPCGHEWIVATRVEHLSAADVHERFDNKMRGA